MAEDAKVVIAWAAERKISLESINIVMDLGFTSVESICTIEAGDLKKSIPIGQQKMILKAVAGLAPSKGEASAPNATANVDIPGENPDNGTPSTSNTITNQNAFECRLAEQINLRNAQGVNGQIVQTPAQAPADPPVTGMYSWQDPQVYLKSTTNSKPLCYNIVDFVDMNFSGSEKVVSTEGDFELVCRTGVRKPKLENVTISQWSGANIAILYKLFQDGALGLSEVFDYLSYTSHIYSLISSYELGSVYLYDREYRRLQAAHKFRWGTAVGHLSAGFLRLRNSGNSQQGNQKTKSTYRPEGQRTSYRPHQSHSSAGKTICNNYNSKWGCTFTGCKYDHVCNTPGCGKSHPSHAHSHVDSKN